MFTSNFNGQDLAKPCEVFMLMPHRLDNAGWGGDGRTSHALHSERSKVGKLSVRTWWRIHIGDLRSELLHRCAQVLIEGGMRKAL